MNIVVYGLFYGGNLGYGGDGYKALHSRGGVGMVGMGKVFKV